MVALGSEGRCGRVAASTKVSATVPVTWLISRAAKVPIRLAACAAATEETPHPAAAISPYIMPGPLLSG